jgi:nucleoside-diphosphate-sugar epimerase
MRVFVAGATGAIGSCLVPQLVVRGHRVTATTRSRRKVEQLRALGAEPVAVDGLDAAAVREAVARAEPEAIVHEMTALAGKPDLKHFDRWFAPTNALRTKGTWNLLSAACAVGVERLVAQSYTGWTNSRVGAGLQTEDDPLDAEPAKAQIESLDAIRYLERAVLEAPLEGIVLRYGSLYGPHASETLVSLAHKRQLPIVGDGGGVWSWIHVDDAAAATIAAVEHGGPGAYNIVDDDPAAVSEWLPYLAEVVDARSPRRVPVWLGRLAIGEAGVRWLTASRGSSNQKAKRELHWRLRYPSWRQGFAHGLHAAPLDATALDTLIGPPPSPDQAAAPLRQAAGGLAGAVRNERP